MGRLIILALCFLWPTAAAAANVANLQGQWSIEMPSRPAYKGTLLIDAENRVTWNATTHDVVVGRSHGYVAVIDGPKVEIPITNRHTVHRAHCTLQSVDMMNCYMTFTHHDKVSAGIILRRVGPGPQKIMPILP